MGAPYLMTRAELVAQRPPGAPADDHFCESFAASIVETYSRPGDLVLDPFAGNGTTLAVATRAGRRALGIEIDPARARLAGRRGGPEARVMTADLRTLPADALPSDVALVLTSPPYMSRVDHPENPLSGYRTLDGDYARYLDELGRIVTRLMSCLRSDGHLVVNVADPTDPGHPDTPLVDDFRALVPAGLTLVDESELRWDVPPEGITRDTCLVYAVE